MTDKTRPFGLRAFRLGHCTLTAPVSEAEAGTVGRLLANMDPWLTLEFSSTALASYLVREDAALHRYVVRVGDAIVGVLCVRFPWLRGPYIEMLGLAEGYQGQGIGKELLHWVEAEARTAGQNLWVTTSSFNRWALDFYQRHGFRKIGTIEGLIRPDYDEFLMHKRLD